MMIVSSLSAKEWLYSWADVDGDKIQEKFIYVIGENGEINVPYVYAPWVTVIAWNTCRTAISIMKLRQKIYWGEDLLLDTGKLPEVPNGQSWHYEETFYDTMFTYVDGDNVVTIWQSKRAKLKRVVTLNNTCAIIRFHLWYHKGDCWKYLGKTGLLMTWNDGKTGVEESKQFVLERLQELKNTYEDSFPSVKPGEFLFKISYSYDDYAKQLDDYSVLAWDGWSSGYPGNSAIFGTVLLPKPEYLFTEYNSAPCKEFTYADWSLKGEMLLAEIRITPRTINLKSHGVFTASIQLSGHAPSEIDLSTVVCEGAKAFDGHYTPNKLVAKFYVDDLIGVKPGLQEFTVTGRLKSGEAFSGVDTVRVIDSDVICLNILPNPVREKAEIRVQLEGDNPVLLRIFSVTGRLVKEITMNRKNFPGLKTIWKREDTNGRRVPPGVYLIQVSSGGAETTRKVVVVD